MNTYELRGRNTDRNPRSRSVMLVLAITVGASILIISPLLRHANQSTLETAKRPLQSSHTIEVTNDMDYDATAVQWYVWGDLTSTLTSVGPIDSGDAITVSLPANIDTNYVFSMTITDGSDFGILTTNVTEDGLDDLGYEYRLIQDDMGVAVVDPGDWPTPQLSPTPWDISAMPTSTPGGP